MQNKVNNTKMAKQTVVKATFTMHENMLGKEVCMYWDQLVAKHVLHSRLEG